LKLLIHVNNLSNRIYETSDDILGHDYDRIYGRLYYPLYQIQPRFVEYEDFYLQPLIRMVPGLTFIAYRKIKEVIINRHCTDGPSPEDRNNQLQKNILKLW
jgi:hypothetical protein